MSGILFASRGVLMLTHSPFTNHAVLRFTSYGIDTVLLVAGLSLMVITQQYPWLSPWLSVKLVLLLVRPAGALRPQA